METKRQRKMSNNPKAFKTLLPPVITAVMCQTNIWDYTGRDLGPQHVIDVWRGDVADIGLPLGKIIKDVFAAIPLRSDRPWRSPSALDAENYRTVFHMRVCIPPVPGVEKTHEIHIMSVERDSQYTKMSPGKLFIRQSNGISSTWGAHFSVEGTVSEFLDEVEKEAGLWRRLLVAQELVPDILPQSLYQYILAPYIMCRYDNLSQ